MDAFTPVMMVDMVSTVVMPAQMPKTVVRKVSWDAGGTRNADHTSRWRVCRWDCDRGCFLPVPDSPLCDCHTLFLLSFVLAFFEAVILDNPPPPPSSSEAAELASESLLVSDSLFPARMGLTNHPLS